MKSPAKMANKTRRKEIQHEFEVDANGEVAFVFEGRTKQRHQVVVLTQRNIRREEISRTLNFPSDGQIFEFGHPPSQILMKFFSFSHWTKKGKPAKFYHSASNGS